MATDLSYQIARRCRKLLYHKSFPESVQRVSEAMIGLHFLACPTVVARADRDPIHTSKLLEDRAHLLGVLVNLTVTELVDEDILRILTVIGLRWNEESKTDSYEGFKREGIEA